jgi:VIT1/CCC1 family predicted Fe2+/Mn2+ transporter
MSATTIASSYVVGGAVPLSPYFFIHNAREALVPSVIVTLIALTIFGFFKGRANGVSPLRSAAQTVIIGGIAAGAAFFLASSFSS